MSDLNIILFQHNIIWGDTEANRHAVEERMQSCDLFVVPETFTTGFGDHMAALAEEPEGPTLQWARQMAAKHGFMFVGTWIVKDNNQCYNCLHWVYPDGTYGTYDKAHTFRVSGEADQIARGTRREVFEWRGWKIKPAVCYDLRFPKWLRNSVEYGMMNDEYPSTDARSSLITHHSSLSYDLLLVCANWPASRREAWSTLLRARAIENLCYVAGCNRTGIDGNDGEYSGDSAIINYKGLPIADGSDICTATISLERLQAFRQKWPLYLDFD